MTGAIILSIPPDGPIPDLGPVSAVSSLGQAWTELGDITIIERRDGRLLIALTLAEGVELTATRPSK